MALIEKRKFNVKKRNYYLFLFIIFLYIMSYTIYLLSSLTINTEIYDNIVDKTIREEKIVRWMTGKIISYVINSVLVLMFLIYISIARFKMKLGFIFLIIWFLIFIGMAASPHILAGSHDEPVRLWTGIVSTIAASFICLVILVEANDLRVSRAIQRREIYKIHKQKTIRKDKDER